MFMFKWGVDKVTMWIFFFFLDNKNESEINIYCVSPNTLHVCVKYINAAAIFF